MLHSLSYIKQKECALTLTAKKEKEQVPSMHLTVRSGFGGWVGERIKVGHICPLIACSFIFCKLYFENRKIRCLLP